MTRETFMLIDKQLRVSLLISVVIHLIFAWAFWGSMIYNKKVTYGDNLGAKRIELRISGVETFNISRAIQSRKIDQPKHAVINTPEVLNHDLVEEANKVESEPTQKTTTSIKTFAEEGFPFISPSSRRSTFSLAKEGVSGVHTQDPRNYYKDLRLRNILRKVASLSSAIYDDHPDRYCVIHLDDSAISGHLKCSSEELDSLVKATLSEVKFEANIQQLTKCVVIGKPEMGLGCEQ